MIRVNSIISNKIDFINEKKKAVSLFKDRIVELSEKVESHKKNIETYKKEIINELCKEVRKFYGKLVEKRDVVDIIKLGKDFSSVNVEDVDKLINFQKSSYEALLSVKKMPEVLALKIQDLLGDERSDYVGFNLNENERGLLNGFVNKINGEVNGINEANLEKLDSELGCLVSENNLSIERDVLKGFITSKYIDFKVDDVSFSAFKEVFNGDAEVDKLMKNYEDKYTFIRSFLGLSVFVFVYFYSTVKANLVNGLRVMLGALIEGYISRVVLGFFLLSVIGFVLTVREDVKTPILDFLKRESNK